MVNYEDTKPGFEKEGNRKYKEGDKEAGEGEDSKYKINDKRKSSVNKL